MTHPESITVSITKAQKLKEAGYPQNGCMLYWCFLDNEEQVVQLHFPRENELAAPTAEEIMQRLPNFIGGEGQMVMHKSLEGYLLAYAFGPMRGGEKGLPVIKDKFLANAAASMWIYLKKNNLLPKES